MLLYIVLTIFLMVLSSAITALQTCNPAAAQTEPKPEAPAAEPMPEAPAALAADASHDTPSEHSEPWPYVGNNQFAGLNVAFTGRMEITLDEAMKQVEANGGRAFRAMCNDVTLLVVGADADKNAESLAAQHNIKRIPYWQYDVMTKTPLTLTPQQFAEIA